MWVVIAKKGLNVHRDDLLSELLGEEKTKQEEYYVVKPTSSYRYNVSSSLSSAKIYKQKSSCERLVKKFQSSQKDISRSPYYWIKDYHLSTKKVTFEEWDLMCNQELNKLERSYEYTKQKIELKRTSFK
jgi:hypothetical protein